MKRFLSKTKGRLEQEQENGTRLVFENGANLCVAFSNHNGEIMAMTQLSEMEVQRLAYFLNEIYKLELVPGFNDCQEHGKTKKKLEEFKQLNGHHLERIHEQHLFLQRFNGTLESVLEAVGEHLTEDAKRQVVTCLKDYNNFSN